MATKLMPRRQQAAVLGNAGGLHGGGAQFVADEPHHLVLHLLQGFGQERGGGFAQLGVRGGGWQRSQFLAMAGHAEFLQGAQGIDRLAHEGNPHAQRAQPFQLRRDREGLGGAGGGSRKHDFDFGIHPLGERRDGGFRIGEAQKQAAETEVPYFAGDLGVSGLRDDGRLRNLETAVATLFTVWFVGVVVHVFSLPLGMKGL